MNQEELRDLLEETGALTTGHFQLSSGLHSDTYCQCAKLLCEPRHASAVGADLAKLFDLGEIDIVVSPAVGGLVIGYTVAAALDVPFIFTEREKSAGSGKGKMSLRRGFEVIPGTKAIVIEDVVTTGGSAAEVVALLTESGVNVTGVGSVIRRGSATEVTQGWKHLLEVSADAWKPESCPLCELGQETRSPGSSRL